MISNKSIVRGRKLESIKIPSRKDFMNGINKIEKYEKRDAMFKVATFLISHSRDNPYYMANGLGGITFDLESDIL